VLLKKFSILKCSILGSEYIKQRVTITFTIIYLRNLAGSWDKKQNNTAN